MCFAVLLSGALVLIELADAQGACGGEGVLVHVHEAVELRTGLIVSLDPRTDPRQAFNDGRPALATGGSSSGPGIAVSANLATVGVGTETSGSILSPATQNLLVGIKPTVGLTSRAGVVDLFRRVGLVPNPRLTATAASS